MLTVNHEAPTVLTFGAVLAFKALPRAKRRRRHLHELIARLKASDGYSCAIAQGNHMAARSLYRAVVSHWELS